MEKIDTPSASKPLHQFYLHSNVLHLKCIHLLSLTQSRGTEDVCEFFNSIRNWGKSGKVRKRMKTPVDQLRSSSNLNQYHCHSLHQLLSITHRLIFVHYEHFIPELLQVYAISKCAYKHTHTEYLLPRDSFIVKCGGLQNLSDFFQVFLNLTEDVLYLLPPFP